MNKQSSLGHKTEVNNTEISKNKTPINWAVLHGNKTSCLNVLWSIPPAPYSSVHDNFIGLLNEMFKLNLYQREKNDLNAIKNAVSFFGNIFLSDIVDFYLKRKKK